MFSFLTKQLKLLMLTKRLLSKLKNNKIEKKIIDSA